MEFDEQTMSISWEMFGLTCAANGDLIYYTLSASFSIPNNEITGLVEFDGGTGKYANTEGYMNITGYADNPVAITTMYMECEGIISIVGNDHYSENAVISQNKSIARKFIKAWDLHNYNKLISLFANEFIYTEIASGRSYTDKESLSMYASATIAGVPDTRFVVISITATKKIAAVEWIWEGTNTVGWPFMGIPATNKYFELPGISVMEIENKNIKRTVITGTGIH